MVMGVVERVSVRVRGKGKRKGADVERMGTGGRGSERASELRAGAAKRGK